MSLDELKKTIYITKVHKGLIIKDSVVVIEPRISKDGSEVTNITNSVLQYNHLLNNADFEILKKGPYQPTYYFDKCDLDEVTILNSLILTTRIMLNRIVYPEIVVDFPINSL